MRKELAPLPGAPHVLDNFSHETFIFVFRILFIQYAILGMSKADATEEIFGLVETVPTIQKVTHVIPAGLAEEYVVEVIADEMVFVSSLARNAPRVAVPTLSTKMQPRAVFAVFQIRHIEAAMYVLGKRDMVARNVFVVDTGKLLVRQ